MWVLILFLLDVCAFFWVIYQAYLQYSEPNLTGGPPFLIWLPVLLGVGTIGTGIWFAGEVPEKFEQLRYITNVIIDKIKKSTKDIINVTKKNTMKILKKMRNFFLFNARDKRMLKLGIINNENEPTEEGKQLYNMWRFNKDRDEFDKEMVQKLEKK